MIWILTIIIIIVGLIVLAVHQKVNVILDTLLKVSRTSDRNDQNLDERLKETLDTLHNVSEMSDKNDQDLETRLQEISRRLKDVEDRLHKH